MVRHDPQGQRVVEVMRVSHQPVFPRLFPIRVFRAVEVDVFRGEVARVHGVIRFALVQVDDDFKLRMRNRFAKLIHRRRRLEAAEAGGFTADMDIDQLLTDPGAGVADGMNDAAPVRIASVPGGFHKG